MLRRDDEIVRESDIKSFVWNGPVHPYRYPSITPAMILAFLAGLGLFAIGGRQLAPFGLFAGAILGNTLPYFQNMRPKK